MDYGNLKGLGAENAHRMIFISDLPKSTSYMDLSDYYEKNVGPCQICIKRPLFKNFYYAFVMFDSIENAKKATEEFRFPKIKGVMARALPYNMHAVKGEPGGKDVQSTSVFVKGFEKLKWTHEDLYAKFCTFGRILSCKVSIDAEHNFLGFGYIQFSKIEEAQRAIQEMDKYDLAGEGYGAEPGTLTVLEYQGKKAVVKRGFNNLYIKNFSKDPKFTEEKLGELFSEFGEVASTCIMRDANGDSKGFGFVCFTDASSAEKALQAITFQKAESDKEAADSKFANIYVREAKKKQQRQAELLMQNFKYKKSIMFFSLFVKNFPPGTTEDELKIYFQSACQGEVTNIQIIPGTQQAFVNFEKQDQCKMAKDFARNVLFKSQYALYVEYCYPKEMRLIRNEEIIDKRAQEKKKNQQQQAQIASLNGSQNLIDLLTMLLKPAFQFNQGNQRRSQSLNSQMSRGPGVMNGGLNQQMMQNQQQPRYQNNSRGGYQGGINQMQNRGHSQAPPPQMQHYQQMNMSHISGAQSVASSSTPQHADAKYAQDYFHEVQQMFIQAEFKKGDKRERREIVGNTIYRHVEKIVGEEKAPKITGMLIDLPDIELNFSISTWNNFEQKVISAYQLISQQDGAPAATISV